MRFTVFFNLLALFILTCIQGTAQTIAFPGAEGAGKFTSGGRGTTTTATTVFEVTNLGDTNTAGTLRYACSQAATYRTIVFRVSGTIHLTAKLNIPRNTTIAGQTAPGDGICIADHPVVINGDNVILRYIRCRLGDRYQNKGMVDGSGGDDALGNLGAKNLIIDHCSVSWSADEALTVYRGDSVTLQWNIISEPLNYSYHFETGDTDFEQHGYGGIWGSRNGSFHHNLIAHCRNRTPRFAGVETYTSPAPGVEKCDFRNNVLYNWGINNIYGGEGGNYNVVNNYFKYGPNTSSSRRYQVVAVDSNATYLWAKYYLKGNYVYNSVTNTNNNWLSVFMKSGKLADTVKSKVTEPFNLPAIAEESAISAYTSVLTGAGASFPKRDTLDERIVNDVRNGTGKIIDVQGGFPHGTDYSISQVAWPALSSATAPTDTDHDGMPDEWETSKGLNINSAADRNYRNAGGYTNLELYLNGLVSGDSGTVGGGNTGEPDGPATATWALTADQTAVTTGNISATSQTLPSNMVASNYQSYSPTTGLYAGQTVNAQRVKPSAGWPANQTEPVADQYVQYAITPINGKKLAVSNMSFDFGDAGSTSLMKANIYYSLDGFSTAGTLLNSSPLTLPKFSSTELFMNASYSLNVMVNSGQTLTVRVYPWWPSAASTSKYLVERNIVFTGTTYTVTPLKLRSFSVSQINSVSPLVALKWETSSEVNTAKFEVERSLDNASFEKVGEIRAMNSDGTHCYSFNDNAPVKGVAYYRLKMIDLDGKYSYSGIEVVKSQASEAITIYPNPVKDKMIVSFKEAAENTSLEIVSSAGVRVMNKPVLKGATQLSLELSNLASGAYFVIYNNGVLKQTAQFIKL